MKLLIVGISGASCSGKTTLATKVQEKFKESILIRQDDYFLPINDSRHTLIPELNHFNWEILSSLDMPKMHSDLLNIINSTNCESTTNALERDDNTTRLLIIEGFSIFNYKPIAKLCEHRYFIEINKDLCWSRRKVRTYDPADVPGYFDKIVWPEYLRHKSEIVNDSDFYQTIRILDGNKTLNELIDVITNDMCKIIK